MKSSYHLNYPKLIKGRKEKHFTEEQEIAVKNYLQKFNVGVNRCKQSLKRHQISIIKGLCEQIYEKYDLYMFTKDYKPKNEHDN